MPKYFLGHSHDDASINVLKSGAISSTFKPLPGSFEILPAYGKKANMPVVIRSSSLGILPAACATGGNVACDPQEEQQLRHPSKRHGYNSHHSRLIPTIPREPSSRRSDRRVRIPVPRSELAKNVHRPAPSRCISGCSGLIGGVPGACRYHEATNYTPDRLIDTCSLRSVPRNVR